MYEEKRNQYGWVFEHFGTTWKKAKMRLFGHVLRSSPADPMNQVTLDGDNLRPRPVHTRRTGRPKVDWVLESYKDAYSIINGQGAAAFNINDLGHLQQVKAHAAARLPPFNKSSPKGRDLSRCSWYSNNLLRNTVLFHLVFVMSIFLYILGTHFYICALVRRKLGFCSLEIIPIPI